ncbi:MAG TPA: proline racemase family protein [Thermomicrobiales bacterium]|nr:proline racemase family protein [Thermomicrobiales bacterium]
MRSERILTTIDAHAGGAALRIVTHGAPRLRGGTMQERLIDMRSNHDRVRRQLLFEPRGHLDMTGAILMSPTHKDADYGVIVMTTGGYATISGHGIIALTTALIETGAVAADGPEVRITFETVVGLVQARASVDQGRVLAVRFRNVPAFRLAKGLPIEVDGRALTVDVAYGGAWFAVATAESLGVTLNASARRDLVRAGLGVRRAVANALDVVHPENEDAAGLFGTIIVGPPPNDDASMLSATVYGDGALDRSPCGTGTSALMACLAADDELSVGDSFVNESLIGSTFTGRIVVPTTVAEHPAVVTEISGRGSVTGFSQLMIDPTDEYRDGFLML